MLSLTPTPIVRGPRMTGRLRAVLGGRPGTRWRRPEASDRRLNPYAARAQMPDPGPRALTAAHV
ncbi:MAG TPA: hypothetical protein VNN74_11540 [Candidatus Micrarchaeia archaeon]|nr:hypothetical protein [Candidatus Micrarchaeia archaeon]